jgi:ABC-2 type transport system permease protein
MTRALRSELIKLSTTRTFIAFVASAVGLSLLIVVLIALLSNNTTEDDLRTTFTADFSALFIALLGVIGMAGEWRHRTIASTVLSTPHRIRLLAAKMIAYAIAGALLSLAVNVAIMSVGTLILSLRNETTLPFSDLIDLLWRNLTVAAFLGPIGVCIGALVRNPAVAIVLVLAWGFVVENILIGLVPSVGRFGFTSGAPAGITQVSPDGLNLLPTGVALLVMAGWVALFFAPAAATFTKRDLV